MLGWLEEEFDEKGTQFACTTWEARGDSSFSCQSISSSHSKSLNFKHDFELMEFHGLSYRAH